MKPRLYSNRIEKERVLVQLVAVPEFYTVNYRNRKQMWKKEKLEQLFVEKIRECNTEHFFCSEAVAHFFGQPKVSAPLFLMEEMLSRYGVRERLILVGNPNPLFDSIFENYMEKVNFLQLVCENVKDYERETEWLYETYGIVAVLQETERNKCRENTLMKSAGKQPETLIVDMEPCGKNGRPAIELKGLPEGTVYMDMCSEEKKRYRISQKHKNIHYLSPESLLNKWCHLDTTAQNGYNTRVKLEVL